MMGQGNAFSLFTNWVRGGGFTPVRFPVPFPDSVQVLSGRDTHSLVPCPLWGYPSLWFHIPSRGTPLSDPMSLTGGTPIFGPMPLGRYPRDRLHYERYAFLLVMVMKMPMQRWINTGFAFASP